MTSYYNEIEPFAANWLRNLISAGLIAPGEVDTRSITDVSADDVRGFTQCHFFAGIGGWSAALRLAGWEDERPVWTGSCPCQPFSAAGKRKGTADERHLWPEFRRLIAECRPATAFGEQVGSKDGRLWLAGVFSGLEQLGYAVAGADIPAAGVGAPHIRQRLWWVANAEHGARRIVGELEESQGNGVREISRKGSRGGFVGNDRTTRRLADDSQYGRQQRTAISRRSDSGVRAEGDRGGLADSCESGRLGIAASERDRSPANAGSDCESEREGRKRGVGGSGAPSELGDASEPRLPLSEQPELSGPQQLDEGRAAQQPGRASWSDFSIIPCLDGKSRRIESGSFPLAHGIPRSLGRGRSKLERMAIRAARANRTGRLKGYGNAIVPEVAAEFIAAFMECSP